MRNKYILLCTICTHSHMYILETYKAHSTYIVHIHIYNMYIQCMSVCVSVSFGFSPFSLLCQNYDKIMRPFLRKNIKTKTKAIEIIYVHTYVFVSVRTYSMSVCVHVLVGPHVRPDTVTPALPLRCRRRTHCRISFEDDARSLRCQTFWLARAN